MASCHDVHWQFYFLYFPFFFSLLGIKSERCAYISTDRWLLWTDYVRSVNGERKKERKRESHAQKFREREIVWFDSGCCPLQLSCRTPSAAGCLPKWKVNFTCCFSVFSLVFYFHSFNSLRVHRLWRRSLSVWCLFSYRVTGSQSPVLESHLRSNDVYLVTNRMADA